MLSSTGAFMLVQTVHSATQVHKQQHALVVGLRNYGKAGSTLQVDVHEHLLRARQPTGLSELPLIHFIFIQAGGERIWKHAT
jgi:hypothetical protein